MPNYSPSTIARIADINRGLQVDTGILPYTKFDAANHLIYTVYGRIIILSLAFEVTTLWVNGTTMKFTWASTVPVVTTQDLSGACSSMDTFAAGRHVVLVGTLTSTAAVVLPTTPGMATNIMCAPLLVGNATPSTGVQQVGQIGYTTATAAASASAGKFTLLYVPVDDGSYAEALV